MAWIDPGHGRRIKVFLVLFFQKKNMLT